MSITPKVTFSNGAIFEVGLNEQTNEYEVKISGGPFTELLALASIDALVMDANVEDLRKLAVLARIVIQLKASVDGEILAI